jgi:hypothetical protein
MEQLSPLPHRGAGPCGDRVRVDLEPPRKRSNLSGIDGAHITHHHNLGGVRFQHSVRRMSHSSHQTLGAEFMHSLIVHGWGSDVSIRAAHVPPIAPNSGCPIHAQSHRAWVGSGPGVGIEIASSTPSNHPNLQAHQAVLPTAFICTPQQISEWGMVAGHGQPFSYTSTAPHFSQA